jgi:hypothetical protein
MAGKGKSPAVAVPLCQIVLGFLYENPLKRTKPKIPKGVRVRIVTSTSNAKKTVTLVETITNKFGLAVFPPYAFGKQKISILIDFKGWYLDLDKDAWVDPKTVTLHDQRHIIRLPDVWDSRKQNDDFADHREGRFKKGILTPSGDVTEEGTTKSPWCIRIDRAWPKMWVKFVYYNTASKVEEPIPPGLRVEAYRGKKMEDANLIGAATALDDTGCVYLPVYRVGVSTKEMVFGFRADADHYFQMDEADLKKRLVTVLPAAYGSLTMVKKHALYAVPTVWRSTGQWTRTSLYHPRPFAKVMSDKNLDPKRTDPLTFHLDDFVLVGQDKKPIKWKKNDRITMFDHRMHLCDPDSEFPCWTISPTFPDGIMDRNAFLAERFYFVAGQGHERCVRVVAYRRTFYDLANGRVTEGDALGARAAMANDHPHQALRELWKPNAPETVGNFHLHYFHECMSHDYAGEGALPTSHVLVYWSTRVVRGTGTTAAQIKEFRHDYLPAAELRLTGVHPGLVGGSEIKRYALREHSTQATPPLPPRWILVRHFFESRDDSNVHCTSRLHAKPKKGFRASMGLTEADYKTADVSEDPNASLADKADVTLKGRFTLAHEIGHALGLVDEYLEPMPVPFLKADEDKFDDWQEPILPEFKQVVEGMPYSCDFRLGTLTTPTPSPAGRSLMYENANLRLRCLLPRLMWVNQFPAVQQLLGNKPQVASYHAGQGLISGKTLRYLLPESNPNPFVPAARDTSKGKTAVTSNGAHGQMQLVVYKIGQDELAYYNAQNALDDVDSILCVVIKLHWRFDNPKKTPKWNSDKDWSDRRVIIQDFERAVWDQMRRVAYVAEASGSIPDDSILTKPTFRRCLIYVRPVHARASAAGAHFRIRVRKGTGTAAQDLSDLETGTLKDDIVNIVESTNQVALLRHCLGLARLNASNALITSVAAADLGFLATWLGTKLGRTYTIKRIASPP